MIKSLCSTYIKAANLVSKHDKYLCSTGQKQSWVEFPEKKRIETKEDITKLFFINTLAEILALLGDNIDSKQLPQCS